MILTEDPLSTAFETVPQQNLTILHNTLGLYTRVSKKLSEANVESTTLINHCYTDFYDSDATFVVFWQKDDVVYCELVKSSIGRVQPTFPAQYLMRVERLKKNGPNAVNN